MKAKEALSRVRRTLSQTLARDPAPSSLMRGIHMPKLGTSLRLFLLGGVIAPAICQAQFLDSFDKNKIEGWSHFTGDGNPTLDIVQQDGHARVVVDATKDKYNVWWTIIKRDESLVNSDFPEVNFNNWHVRDAGGDARILTVNANQWSILRWDLKKFRSLKGDGSGLLELTTHSVPQGGNYVDAYGEDFGIEFGKVRVIEILGGDPEWEQRKVNYENFIKGAALSDVFNGQMVFDTEVSGEFGSKTLVTIPRPVLQRMLDGKTKGLLIRPLGALDASFYASENQKGGAGPRLHFNTVR